jgi:hypothetical protein
MTHGASCTSSAQLQVQDRWTSEESLALVEQVEGTECIHGVPLPQYVTTTREKARWSNCVRVAAQSSGEPVPSVLVQETARVLFDDRERFTD